MKETNQGGEGDGEVNARALTLSVLQALASSIPFPKWSRDGVTPVIRVTQRRLLYDPGRGTCDTSLAARTTRPTDGDEI